MSLNADVPPFPCLVRREYLYDLKAHQGEVEPCYVFGLASIPSRALMFHIMLSNGALIYRLPISALVTRAEAPEIPLHYLQLWDCFSVEVSVIEYEFLKGLRCATILKDRTWHEGTYEFTVDWHGTRIAEDPGEGGHKCAHIIRLNNGCFAAQPNNRMRWFEPSFITKPFPAHPDYLTNTTLWSCENKGARWATEDTAAEFYEVHEEK